MKNLKYLVFFIAFLISDIAIQKFAMHTVLDKSAVIGLIAQACITTILVFGIQTFIERRKKKQV
ncbi:hypothetical protein K4L44_16830 [Halosquirtibacter laminarini]|uniref:Uncharacterized protein n=1 Tax=Halosquirtibacter laminarini TaxID=3374600 RepID=A0AC61NNC6_9BACT|nr:hypothetical protein K4L44_16830 [Prolixibacteraceae bacterium]